MTLDHRVWWSDHALAPGNGAFAGAMAGIHGDCVAFIDSGVAASWPELGPQLTAAFAALPGSATRLAHIETIPGGEACKDGTAFVEHVARIVFDHGVSRHGAVIAIGGGAVLDAVGFGAAISHRGVRLIRVPTTTLAQDDSAMGVKCGVNAFGQKNALGAFAAPWAVLCDSRFLTTLPATHWLGGFSEAIKIALLKEPSLFEHIREHAAAIASRDMEIAAPVIRRSAWLHRLHILEGGDPFELGSARPLDHGHWSAHRLEAMSGFTVPHGQAVSVGLALDALLAVEMHLLDAAAATRIVATLTALDLPIWHPLLAESDALLAGLEHFRQHLGGAFSIPLLTEIGASREVDRVEPAPLRKAVASLRTLAA